MGRKKMMMLLAIISLITSFSCRKEKELEVVPNKDVRAEKTNVKTFEIINLISKENLNAKYSAKFGSVSIELLKTSDSTLTFYVPDVNVGEALLKFDLGTIKFNVSKSVIVNPNDFINDLTKSFDIQINSLNASTPSERAEIDSLNQFKNEVVTLFNSLSITEKQQTILIYDANKAVFKAIANSTYKNLDGVTSMSQQSQCPKTDFKTFYGCTAENLGESALELQNASKEFLKMIGMAGAMAGVALNTSVLGPAAWGLTAVGISLPLGTAAYLLITEVRPAAVHFKYSLYPFLSANWIFTKALFQSVTQVFQDQVSTSLNLTPKFRSITANDGSINSGSLSFINAMNSLSEYWNKMTRVFGIMPTFKNTESSTTIATNEISITDISNNNVQYLGNSGQSIRFKTISGKEENFSYKIRVAKQGFVEEKNQTGKILAVTIPDSTELYRLSAMGKYTVTQYVGNGPNSKLFCELKNNNEAIYTIFDDPSWPNGYIFRQNWTVRKINNEYFITTSFTNPGHIISEAKKLTYPVISFFYRHNYLK
jgi:hypothetical protein